MSDVVMEYITGKFKEAQDKKDQLSAAIKTRKRTVLDFYMQIGALKGVIASLNSRNKSTARVRTLKMDMAESLLQHEQTLAHLKVMRHEQHQEVHMLRMTRARLEVASES